MAEQQAESKKAEKKKKKSHRTREKIWPEERLPPLVKESAHSLALRRLRSRLRPLVRHPVYGSKLDQTDAALTRWLEASRNNIFLAAAKIQKCMLFRERKKVDALLDTYLPPDALVSHYPGGLCGEDRTGSPVSYELLGQLDVRGLMRSVSREALDLFRLYQFERISKYLKKLSKERGKTIDSILVVVDMRDTKMDILWSPGLVLWKEAIHLLNNYYPGMVKEVLIICAPTLISELYLSIRPYLGDCLHRFTIVGDNYFKALLQRIDAHNIPAYLGGYKCDYNNNPKCSTWLNWSGKVPKWHYCTHEQMAADVFKVTILGGSREIHEVHIAQAQSRIIWKIFDISEPFVFAVYKNCFRDPSKAVFQKTTMTSTSPHRTFGIRCDTAARYFLVFDNSKTLARPLRVVYRVDVIAPLSLKSQLKTRYPLGDIIDFWGPINANESSMRQHYLRDHGGYDHRTYTRILSSMDIDN